MKVLPTLSSSLQTKNAMIPTPSALNYRHEKLRFTPGLRLIPLPAALLSGCLSHDSKAGTAEFFHFRLLQQPLPERFDDRPFRNRFRRHQIVREVLSDLDVERDHQLSFRNFRRDQLLRGQ